MINHNIYSNDFTELSIDGVMYRFDILNLSTHLPAIPAVYMISSVDLLKRLSTAPYPYQILGLGITSNLQKDIVSHKSWDKWLLLGADLIIFYSNTNIAHLELIYSGLSEIYKDCNF